MRGLAQAGKSGNPWLVGRSAANDSHRAREHGNCAIERNFCAPHADFQDFPPQCTDWRRPENQETPSSTGAARLTVSAVRGRTEIARLSAIFARSNADLRDFLPQCADWRESKNREAPSSAGVARLTVSAVRGNTGIARLNAIFAHPMRIFRISRRNARTGAGRKIGKPAARQAQRG